MRIKNLIWTIATAAVIAACNGGLEPDSARQDAALGYEHGGKVTFVVKPDFSQGGKATKSLGNIPEIENLYVAVFDSSGFRITEYVQANPFTPATSNDTDYQYTIELKVSEKPRILHFIANAPEEIRFGSETEVIGELYKDEGGSAYWQRIVLPSITARPEEGDEDYSARIAAYDSVVDALNGVKLIRNYSKVTVEETCDNFELEGFWFVNYADRGSVAPYNRNTGRFMDNYIDYPTVESLEGPDDEPFTFNEGEADEYSIDGGNYQGFMLATTNFIDHEPFDDAHIHAVNGDGKCEGFVYEREKALSLPMYLIIKGKYTQASGSVVPAFYKIAMQDGDGDFYAMLRNFDYLVQIQGVSSSGYADQNDAVAGVPSGDISVNVEYQGLPNISDGDSRMTVSETTVMVIGARNENSTVRFWYKYEPDITASGACNGRVIEDPDNPKTDEPYVTINYEGTSGSTGDVISSLAIDGEDDASGRRSVTVTTTPVGDLLKTQSIFITGKKWDGIRYQTITRTINLVLREPMNLSLSASPNTDSDGNGYVEAGVGESVVINLGIEGGLPSSIFPLEFKIDPAAGTLTPDIAYSSFQELPVRSGLNDGGYPAYWFEKTLTWADYVTAPIIDGLKNFPVYFSTILSNSATAVNVSQKYFAPESVEIRNFVPETFTNLEFSGAQHTIGQNESFSFSMSSIPSDGTVTVAMKGLEPASSANLEYVGKDGEYWLYKFGGVTSTAAAFDVVPFLSGTAGIKLSAHLFDDASESIFVMGGSLPVGTVLFEDTFGTKNNVAISAYDGNGVTSDYNKTISYSLSGSNTVISTAANMTSGHIRYSSSTRNDKATITLSGINPYGAKKLSLSFDAYINNTLRVSGTSSVGGSTPKAISSGSNEYEVQIDESAENIAVVFTITHANLSSTGTLGIDNVKLTVVE